MSQFSSKSWGGFLAAYARSGALERRALAYIHNTASLNELAERLSLHLSIRNVRARVRVGSVWIDGTPQAKAQTSHGPVQCELSDLLVVMNVYRGGLIKDRAAVLIQAKVNTSPDEIPPGRSTKKERALLEEYDESQQIELFRDTKATSKIGAYSLKFGGHGFKNHAR